MKNRSIAKSFQLLGDIMELHDENPFKIKSYSSAYINLRKFNEPLCGMSQDELVKLPGIGAAIADKIIQLCNTGKIETLERFKEKTPEGVIEMLSIRGLGPKKIKTIWKELGIETPGELLYACSENRLVQAKGFGAKTQADMITKLEYYMSNIGLYHYGFVADDAQALISKIKIAYPQIKVDIIGDIARKMPIVKGIELLTTNDSFISDATLGIVVNEDTEHLQFRECDVIVTLCELDEFEYMKYIHSSSEEFVSALKVESKTYASQEELFDSVNCQYISPELRDYPSYIEAAKSYQLPFRVEISDIKGVVHNHSSYSDGLHTIEEMAQSCIDKGYKYLVMSDHSQSAGYAGGLKYDRLVSQWEEIDRLNANFTDFKIFKSIESDILVNGELDYPVDVLEKFDLVIASIHSVLSMDEEKATKRLLKAIENPYTTILGHPTGRLLLGRPGYPIDYKTIIDACANHQVSIELNCNPQRLDLDYEWIPYAMNKGVMISINPDAHTVDQIDYIPLGVEIARKGGLTPQYCLNAKDRSEFENWIVENRRLSIKGYI